MASNVTWEQVRGDFEYDGSLRDIYVLGAGVTGWNSFLAALSHSGYAYSYEVHGQIQSVPESVMVAIVVATETNSLLSINLDGICVNCHFFDFDDIEFDIDPQEVVGQAQLDRIVSFMQWLANCVAREVILTDENQSTSVILRVSAQVVSP